jgi:hypothetical protein
MNVGRLMLSEILRAKKEKSKEFQVLFLRNDPTQKVEVQDVREVDFFKVQEHLKHGESVFITSKRSQKLKPPKEKRRVSIGTRRKLVTAFYLDHV